MRKKYFRITAYHPSENLTAIFDSYGLFRSLKTFISYLISKGFEIVESGSSRQFLDGSFPKISYNISHFCLQALQCGKPTYTEYSLSGKAYAAIHVNNSIYIPDKKKLV